MAVDISTPNSFGPQAVLVANLHLTADLLDASGKPSSRQEQRTQQLKICEEVLHDRPGTPQRPTKMET